MTFFTDQPLPLSPELTPAEKKERAKKDRAAKRRARKRKRDWEKWEKPLREREAWTAHCDAIRAERARNGK